MGRLLAFLLRNWPLKLGAVALATVLYAGLVVAQDAREWPGFIPIETRGQPSDAFLLDRGVTEVAGIRYRAPVEMLGTLRASDFRAFIDLSRVTPQRGGAPVTVPVMMESADRRIVIVDWRPREVRVRLDPVIDRQFAVTVAAATPPEGFSAGVPRVDPGSVTVRGASSLVQRVRQVVARVTIDPSGINVDGEYELLPLDDSGEIVTPLDLDPQRAHVSIPVDRRLANASVPVTPRVVGTPATGSRVVSVTPTPLAVTVQGGEPFVKALETISTEPIDATGKTDDFEASAALVIPAGMRVLGDAEVTVSVSIEVERGTRTFSVGVATSGARRDRAYALSVPTVTVVLSGTISRLHEIGQRPDRITAFVRVRSLAPGRHDVPVEVRVPPDVTVTSVEPSRVSVTVTRTPRTTPAP